jgi:hypothetical protein
VKRAAWCFLGALAACGGGEETANMEIAFQQHALVCDIPNLQAKMQITNVAEICMLEVNDDRTVTGLCPDIPTGEVRAFRLVYFISVTSPALDVQLATAIETLDLTSETRSLVTLEFGTDSVETAFDDDNDRLTNIVEVCEGRNPLLMDQ